jgi:hypothetical protein
MQRGYKTRDFDEWYEELIILQVKEIDGTTRIRILEDTHYDSETEEPFWHGIKIQRVSKNKQGRWVYRDKLNIPFDAFPEFCNLVLKTKEQWDGIKKDLEELGT